MKTIAAVNAKGGAGKTTFTFFTAQALARLGFKVLVCDLDDTGAAHEVLQLDPHIHPNIRSSNRLTAPADFQPDVRLIDTEGKSALDATLRQLPKTPPPDLFVIPSSASALDIRQLGFTNETIKTTSPKARVSVLWCRINTRTTIARPEVLINYKQVIGAHAFTTLVPYLTAYASMSTPYDALRPQAREVWDDVAKELATMLGLKVKTS